MALTNVANDYKLNETVGFGSSATVYRSIHVPSSLEVAVKVIELESYERNQIEQLRGEIQVMAMCKSPNVLPVLKCLLSNTKLYIVTPYLSVGSVLDVMRSAYPKGLDETSIATILKQGLCGLDYLHRNGHIHRDVKCGNLLIDGDGTVMLADFGVTASLEILDKNSTRKTFVGTPCWMAPEVMEQRRYNCTADIWSFGITCLEMAYGEAPMARLPPIKILMATISGQPPTLDRSATQHKYSKQFKELIELCLVRKVESRATSSKLLVHSFFKNAKKRSWLVSNLLSGLAPLPDRMRSRMNAKRGPVARALDAVSRATTAQPISWDFDIKSSRSPSPEPEATGVSVQFTQPEAPESKAQNVLAEDSEVTPTATNAAEFPVVAQNNTPDEFAASTAKKSEPSSNLRQISDSSLSRGEGGQEKSGLLPQNQSQSPAAHENAESAAAVSGVNAANSLHGDLEAQEASKELQQQNHQAIQLSPAQVVLSISSSSVVTDGSPGIPSPPFRKNSSSGASPTSIKSPRLLDDGELEALYSVSNDAAVPLLKSQVRSTSPVGAGESQAEQSLSSLVAAPQMQILNPTSPDIPPNPCVPTTSAAQTSANCGILAPSLQALPTISTSTVNAIASLVPGEPSSSSNSPAPPPVLSSGSVLHTPPSGKSRDLVSLDVSRQEQSMALPMLAIPRSTGFTESDVAFRQHSATAASVLSLQSQTTPKPRNEKQGNSPSSPMFLFPVTTSPSNITPISEANSESFAGSQQPQQVDCENSSSGSSSSGCAVLQQSPQNQEFPSSPTASIVVASSTLTLDALAAAATAAALSAARAFATPTQPGPVHSVAAAAGSLSPQYSSIRSLSPNAASSPAGNSVLNTQLTGPVFLLAPDIAVSPTLLSQQQANLSVASFNGETRKQQLEAAVVQKSLSPQPTVAVPTAPTSLLGDSSDLEHETNVKSKSLADFGKSVSLPRETAASSAALISIFDDDEPLKIQTEPLRPIPALSPTKNMVSNLLMSQSVLAQTTQQKLCVTRASSLPGSPNAKIPTAITRNVDSEGGAISGGSSQLQSLPQVQQTIQLSPFSNSAGSKTVEEIFAELAEIQLQSNESTQQRKKSFQTGDLLELDDSSSNHPVSEPSLSASSATAAAGFTATATALNAQGFLGSLLEQTLAIASAVPKNNQAPFQQQQQQQQYHQQAQSSNLQVETLASVFASQQSSRSPEKDMFAVQKLENTSFSEQPRQQATAEKAVLPNGASSSVLLAAKQAGFELPSAHESHDFEAEQRELTSQLKKQAATGAASEVVAPTESSVENHLNELSANSKLLQGVLQIVGGYCSKHQQLINDHQKQFYQFQQLQYQQMMKMQAQQQGQCGQILVDMMQQIQHHFLEQAQTSLTFQDWKELGVPTVLAACAAPRAMEAANSAALDAATLMTTTTMTTSTMTTTTATSSLPNSAINPNTLSANSASIPGAPNRNSFINRTASPFENNVHEVRRGRFYVSEQAHVLPSASSLSHQPPPLLNSPALTTGATLAADPPSGSVKSSAVPVNCVSAANISSVNGSGNNPISNGTDLAAPRRGRFEVVFTTSNSSSGEDPKASTLRARAFSETTTAGVEKTISSSQVATCAKIQEAENSFVQSGGVAAHLDHQMAETANIDTKVLPGQKFDMTFSRSTNPDARSGSASSAVSAALAVLAEYRKQNLDLPPGLVMDQNIQSDISYSSTASPNTLSPNSTYPSLESVQSRVDAIYEVVLHLYERVLTQSELNSMSMSPANTNSLPLSSITSPTSPNEGADSCGEPGSLISEICSASNNKESAYSDMSNLLTPLANGAGADSLQPQASSKIQRRVFRQHLSAHTSPASLVRHVIALMRENQELISDNVTLKKNFEDLGAKISAILAVLPGAKEAAALSNTLKNSDPAANDLPRLEVMISDEIPAISDGRNNGEPLTSAIESEIAPLSVEPVIMPPGVQQKVNRDDENSPPEQLAPNTHSI